MSEISNHSQQRVSQLLELVKGMLNGENGKQLYEQHLRAINSISSHETVLLFDEVMKLDYPIKQIKVAVNRTLNLLHKTIDNHKSLLPESDTYLWYLMENNRIMADTLDNLKPLIKDINREKPQPEILNKIKVLIEKLLLFKKHYVQKENLFFPLMEQYFPQHRCLQIMWSFHDDIIRNLKEAHELLKKDRFEKIPFNRLTGLIFFNMLAIKFREEKILFPVMLEHIPQHEFELLLPESLELGYPYITPTNIEINSNENSNIEREINLGTGTLTPQKIALLFNHLPVDITYVDENDVVQYFSTPKKRIFPRTKAILGRNVSNCHPPESVHVVEQIVDSFKSGDKNEASFWINMKDEFILIQYFAIRNELGEYKGVVEVTQEISNIQKIEGEKRLLDW